MARVGEGADYSYKLSLGGPELQLSLGSQALRVRSKKNSGEIAERTIDYGAVRRFRELSEIHVVDRSRGEFAIRRCAVFAAGAKALHISSGYVTDQAGAQVNRLLQVADNQVADFDAFVAELKQRVAAQANAQGTKVTVESGWLAAAIAWWLVALLGVGLCVLGVIMLLGESDLVAALLPIAFCLVFGPITAWAAAVLGIGFWPKRVTLAESLEPQA